MIRLLILGAIFLFSCGSIENKNKNSKLSAEASCIFDPTNPTVERCTGSGVTRWKWGAESFKKYADYGIRLKNLIRFPMSVSNSTAFDMINIVTWGAMSDEEGGKYWGIGAPMTSIQGKCFIKGPRITIPRSGQLFLSFEIQRLYLDPYHAMIGIPVYSNIGFSLEVRSKTGSLFKKEYRIPAETSINGAYIERFTRIHNEIVRDLQNLPPINITGPQTEVELKICDVENVGMIIKDVQAILLY